MILKIAEEYAREAGVRNFEKCVDKINRKVITENMSCAEEKFQNAKKEFKESLKNLSEEEKNQKKSEESKIKFENFFDSDFEKEILPSEIEKYLGKPVFDESEIKKADIPGTAISFICWKR